EADRRGPRRGPSGRRDHGRWAQNGASGLQEERAAAVVAVLGLGSYSNSSSSSTSSPKYFSAVSTGCGCSISTPASRSRSSGSFEQPPLRKLKYASSSFLPPPRTRWLRAIEALRPVAYL